MLTLLMQKQLILPSRLLYSVQRLSFSQSTGTNDDPLPYKNLKFSAFNKPDGIPRDYTVKDEWKLRMRTLPEKFVPKEEYSKRPFDPNIRHRMDTISNDLLYRGL
jgi:hypothetical protein